MSYLVLSAVALTIAVGVAASALLIRRPARLGSAVAAAALTAAVLVVLTAVFDSLMIAAGLMEYTAEHLLGWFIGLAPIEDFAYPIAAVILLPALWLLAAPRPRYQRTVGADHAQ
ncbi:lycopene cyclase domain-containing protein [Microterricola gilva]|uniref:Lycopene cyclase domain-containing protein n=1 Tax=Microterricola gilva TaxID=393267 RepID=A0A4Q8ARZ4_9MICO|nr:lycopene cyclase domain-containing protein [Microterricola gilva]RZU66895.1 lycopene cyclase domain-containing protein [Microterricola gilva]